jgi:enoyl-CoA hydratase/carnithine racemase
MTAKAMPGTLRVSEDAGVSTIWIDNPRLRNALTKEMWKQLPGLVSRLADDSRTRVIVLRGVEGNFSAGADVEELVDILHDASTGRHDGGYTTTAEQALSACPKPTIAAIDGYCIGGGWQLAGACDIRVASSRAAFGITPSKLGIIYPLSAIQKLVELIGPAHAKYLLFSGDLINAATAIRLGLISVVVEGELDAGINRIVETLLSRSQLAMEAMKDLIDVIVAGGDGLAARNEVWQREMDRSDDPAIGIQAFLEKRPPKFTWVGERFWQERELQGWPVAMASKPPA